MAPNKALILAKHPVGLPVPYQDLVITSGTYDPSTPPPAGGLILQTLSISYDPYLRGRMRAATASYIAGFELGQPLVNNAISRVVASSNPRFKAGDVVVGYSSFQEYVTVQKDIADNEAGAGGAGGLSLLHNPLELDPNTFLGALGMPGLTAYASFYEIGNPKKGDTLFVSAASGAVGQIVGQLAKREGLRVIGSVGSDAKLKFITEELGFDVGFNYKKEKPDAALARLLGELGSSGLDIYFDNVGGEQLDASIAAMNTFGRIIACGSVSQTSLKAGETHGIANFPLVVAKRLNIRGFVVFDQDIGPKYSAEHQKNMQQWIKDGSIVVKMSITEGIDKAAEGLVGMLKGDNFGKAILKIAS